MEAEAKFPLRCAVMTLVFPLLRGEAESVAQIVEPPRAGFQFSLLVEIHVAKIGGVLREKMLPGINPP